MNFSLESIGLMLLATIVAGEKDKAVALLQAFHDFNPYLYNAGLNLAMYGLKTGEKAALKTATKLDDQGIADLEVIIVASGTKNGLTL